VLDADVAENFLVVEVFRALASSLSTSLSINTFARALPPGSKRALPPGSKRALPPFRLRDPRCVNDAPWTNKNKHDATTTIVTTTPTEPETQPDLTRPIVDNGTK